MPFCNQFIAWLIFWDQIHSFIILFVAELELNDQSTCFGPRNSNMKLLAQKQIHLRRVGKFYSFLPSQLVRGATAKLRTFKNMSEHWTGLWRTCENLIRNRAQQRVGRACENLRHNIWYCPRIFFHLMWICICCWSIKGSQISVTLICLKAGKNN